MAYYEDNVLYKNSFAISIGSVSTKKKRKKDNKRTIPITSHGMFDMPGAYDVINGELADELFEHMKGHRLKRFHERCQLLRERYKIEFSEDS